MVRAVPRSGRQGLAGRLGPRPGGGGGGVVGDARAKIIASTRMKTVDARDKLVVKAKGVDARQKLEKIRNMKEGRLEVKAIGSGKITLTKKTDGKLELSTRKKAVAQAPKKEERIEVKSIGQFTKTISASGKVTLASRSSSSGMRSRSEGRPERGRAEPGVLRTAEARGSMRPGEPRGAGILRTTDVRPRAHYGISDEMFGGKMRSNFRGTRSPDRISSYRYENERFMGRTRSPLVRGSTGRSPSLSPPPYHRSLHNKSRSPAGGGMFQRARSRSRSPLRRDLSPPGLTDYGRRRGSSRSPPPRGTFRMDTYKAVAARREESPVMRRGGPVYDYDDPREVMERDSELMRRRINSATINREKDRESDERITLAGRMEQGIFVSPLQGTKVVITNLQSQVSQEDILELFGDIGPLKRAKLVNPGHAEVWFVKVNDALRAVETYHNRQLDGKPMKCQIVGSKNVPASGGPTSKLPPSLSGKNKSGSPPPTPTIESIHKALFKKGGGRRPTFTITMPKKKFGSA